MPVQKGTQKRPANQTKAATVGANWGSWRVTGGGRRCSVKSEKSEKSNDADQPSPASGAALRVSVDPALARDLAEDLEWRERAEGMEHCCPSYVPLRQPGAVSSQEPSRLTTKGDSSCGSPSKRQLGRDLDWQGTSTVRLFHCHPFCRSAPCTRKEISRRLRAEQKGNEGLQTPVITSTGRAGLRWSDRSGKGQRWDAIARAACASSSSSAKELARKRLVVR